MVRGSLALTKPPNQPIHPAGPKFLLQIKECYLKGHPTVCTQQLLHSQAFRTLPSLFN